MARKKLTPGQRAAKHLLPCVSAMGHLTFSVPYTAECYDSREYRGYGPRARERLEKDRAALAKYIDRLIVKHGGRTDQ